MVTPERGRESSRSRVEVRRVAASERKCEARRKRVRVRKVVFSEWNYETRSIYSAIERFDSLIHIS